MTSLEAKIANALLRCSFQAGSADKRFVKQLPNWAKRTMTEKGKAFMITLLHKYRRQIKNYDELCLELNPDDFALKVNLFGEAEINRKKA